MIEVRQTEWGAQATALFCVIGNGKQRVYLNEEEDKTKCINTE